MQVEIILNSWEDGSILAHVEQGSDVQKKSVIIVVDEVPFVVVDGNQYLFLVSTAPVLPYEESDIILIAFEQKRSCPYRLEVHKQPKCGN